MVDAGTARATRDLHLRGGTRSHCERRYFVKPLDYLVFGLVILGSLVLAAFRLCPVDWLWAVLTIAVAAFWMFAIYRRERRANRANRSQER